MIVPVILEKTLDEIERKVRIVEQFADLIQVDFVDGSLFKGETFLDAYKLDTLHPKTKIELHLMVSNPLEYLTKKINCVTKVCSQIEALEDNTEFIKRARELGYKVGLSVGPDTNYKQLEKYLDQLDYVQFMDIIPGKQGGNSQIPEVLIKIGGFNKEHPKARIQVDGGIKINNIKNLVDVGVDDFVVGSEIFKSSNPQQKYVQLSDMVNQLTNNEITSLKDKKIKKIAILGGAAWQPEEQPYKDAFDVCKILAEAGYELVNGGGPGVMRASTKGGHAGKGRVIAITYHPNKPKRHYEGVDPENDFDDEIITLDYFDRTKVMLQTTQLHIVFKGSLGTLSEFGMTWISSWIHEPNSKPIILYGSFWKTFLDMIDDILLVSETEKKILKICTTPEEVVEYVRSLE